VETSIPNESVGGISKPHQRQPVNILAISVVSIDRAQECTSRFAGIDSVEYRCLVLFEADRGALSNVRLCNGVLAAS
jgi:hypothetical protein